MAGREEQHEHNGNENDQADAQVNDQAAADVRCHQSGGRMPQALPADDPGERQRMFMSRRHKS